MISISYLSTVNTLTSSFKYMNNGAVIKASNVCHISRKWHFHKFKVYIEAEITTQCIVCNNCNMSIFIPSSNVKEGVLCIIQMLRINNGLRKCTKRDQFHIILRDMNPLGIDQPCLTIANNEVLFEKYIVALKRDKYAIDIDGEYAINSNRLFFDFILRMFDHLNQLYEMEKVLLLMQS